MIMPLIISLCVHASSIYEDACRGALEAGAKQSGVEERIEAKSRKIKKQVIRYIDPSDIAVTMFSVASFMGKYTVNREATIVTRFQRRSSIAITIGEDRLNFRFSLDF